MIDDCIILEGKDLDELIEEGLEKLNKTKDEVKVDILEEGRTIVGITIKDYKIKLSVREESISKKKEKKERKKEKEFLNIDLSRLKSLTDAGVEIKITKDKMEAYMILNKPNKDNNSEDEEVKESSSEEVIRELKEYIKYGLDEENVKLAITNKNYGIKTLIAKGVFPIDGINGYIDYKFKNSIKNSPHILADGSADFRNLNLITNIKKGDTLAVLNQAIPGQDGMNVFGETLKHKKAIEAKFNYGINVVLSQDETELISELDGQVSIENKKIKVYEVHTITGDVDNSTGNIEFNGNVRINGNVLTGFKVVAKGNIEIDGVVEGALIKSGGDLIIKRGIQGYNMAEIFSEGNILTNYIENSKIICEKDIKSEAIMHSETLCEGSVEVSGKKGLLVGGLCKAVKEINAKVIGSNMATTTLLEVGIDPRVREREEELRKLKKSTGLDIDKFGKMITLLKKLDNQGQLSEDKKEMLSMSITAKAQLEEQCIDIEDELEDIEEKIANFLDGKIKVQEIIYPGVRITMGNSKMRIDEPREHCMIYRDQEDCEIKVGTL